jgi:hypothetical protein
VRGIRRKLKRLLSERTRGCSGANGRLGAQKHLPSRLTNYSPWEPHWRNLRLVLSALGPFYALQEIRVCANVEPKGLWVEEQRFAGLEDRRLAHFVKATQGVLRKRRLIGLDAAFLSTPLTPASAPEEPARTLWNALFDPEPMGGLSGEYVSSQTTISA